MAFDKPHIGLLVLDDDPNKTPLENTRTEAIEWWNTLQLTAKSKALQDYGFNLNDSNQVGWAEIIAVYKIVHNKV